jgi:hypothetical protein
MTQRRRCCRRENKPSSTSEKVVRRRERNAAMRRDRDRFVVLLKTMNISPENVSNTRAVTRVRERGTCLGRLNLGEGGAKILNNLLFLRKMLFLDLLET